MVKPLYSNGIKAYILYRYFDLLYEINTLSFQNNNKYFL